jgi:hypothetical protein
VVLAEVGTHAVVDAATGGPAVDPDQVSYSSGAGASRPAATAYSNGIALKAP